MYQAFQIQNIVHIMRKAQIGKAGRQTRHLTTFITKLKSPEFTVALMNTAVEVAVVGIPVTLRTTTTTTTVTSPHTQRTAMKCKYKSDGSLEESATQ